ncbi:DUF6950 family protein, partial [Roseicella frigidaeris]|uniref:DUF6950 family protein n=1 Tax=Roseicella frigidaeris TaxID=2230885 RepID=UPI0038D10354
MTRRPDWPGRLAALLSAAEARPFDAHRWNCGRFALAAVEAVTGDRPRVRVLLYLEATADSAGFPRIPPAFAYPLSRPHLASCATGGAMFSDTWCRRRGWTGTRL